MRLSYLAFAGFADRWPAPFIPLTWIQAVGESWLTLARFEPAADWLSREMRVR
jgi:hypothetical protein